MSYIGSVIERYRCKLKMSRKELSENICTEKYVYLIEKGNRSPSVDVVSLFSDKLGVDLFDYYKYLGCEDPIEVRKKMNEFNMHREKRNFIKLKEATDVAFNLPDFHCKPWIYEIEFNKILYMAFVEQRYDESIIELKNFLSRIEQKYSQSILMANSYTLLSACYQIVDDLLSAKSAVELAYEIVRNKSENENERCVETVITVRISFMSMKYLLGEFNEVINEGIDLLNYQYKLNAYERIFYTFFYLSFAYYKIGEHDNAIKCFKKGVYLLMIESKPMDAYYISMQDLFYVLLNDRSMNKEIINEFKNKYKLDYEFK